MQESKFIRHSACPSCGSSNNLAIYSDHEHCFTMGCSYFKQYTKEYNISDSDHHPIKHAASRPLTSLPTTQQPAITDRGLLAATVNRYSVSVDTNEESHASHVYPYFDQDGNHVANKVRKKGEKAFYWEGAVKTGTLFGQQLFPQGARAITVVEGEADAMAAYQLTGSRFPCVSVKSASMAKTDCVNSFEYLNSFDKIVLCFDNDDAGRQATQQVAALFAPGKVSVMKLALAKDANDYLMKGLEKEYINEWFRAPTYLPDGLQLGSDGAFLEEIISYKESRSIPYIWEGLNLKTYGIRTSELVLLTADTGVGKTSIIKEIEHSLLSNPTLIEENIGVGFLHLEEPKRDLALGLMSIENNKPYHYPDVDRTEQELRDVYKKIMDTNRVVIWDHFGSNDIDTVLSKIRHMAALGCKYIFLDHLTIVVSDQSGGDERKSLDEISTKIKTLTMNLDIAVFCVIHINRQGQVRGSAGPEQVANIVIRLERDKKETDDWRRNITKVSVEKNRKFGRTGPACYLYYNEITGRLEELDKEQADLFETGNSVAGSEFDIYK